MTSSHDNTALTHLLEEAVRNLGHHLFHNIRLLLLLLLLLSTVVLLSARILRLPTLVLLSSMSTPSRGQYMISAGAGSKPYIHPPLILLLPISQSQLVTNPLYGGRQLPDPTLAMITFPDNNMQALLAPLRGGRNALLQDLLGLLDKQPVQIYRVRRRVGVVGAENKVARLAVIGFHLAPVLFSFLRQCVCERFVAALVSGLGAL
jgi:hypothetical protein